MKRDFERLAEIGSTGDGGVHRPALSDSHLEARHWFAELARREGFELRVDGAGNHSARLPCGRAGAPTLLLGSHLDSVPHGGRFDGALGVVAALEVLRAVRQAGVERVVDLEAIDFTDEEGTWVCLLGSRAVAGTLSRTEFDRPRGSRQELTERMRVAGMTESGALAAARDPATLLAFLELHIEQGPRLLSSGADVGIVDSIVGIGSFDLQFNGRADHAGTTPIDRRRDAGRGAAATIVEAFELARREFSDCTVNFGRMVLTPGAYNIVPAHAELAVEFRAPETVRLHEFERELTALARRRAESLQLDLCIIPGPTIAAVPCAPGVRQLFGEACRALGLSAIDLSSGAGHDTGTMAGLCPAGMIFVPSVGGSHSSREYAEWQACIDGTNTLLLATLALATEAAGYKETQR
ncbi:MAG TPA: Zn-dependent hydrolase [Candidatus Polarisedimenticolaceae bacterium]|nr:Zn-dependent hydrolase [Candidatus Polarisedimenticolaceae bacterium]